MSIEDQFVENDLFMEKVDYNNKNNLYVLINYHGEINNPNYICINKKNFIIGLVGSLGTTLISCSNEPMTLEESFPKKVSDIFEYGSMIPNINFFKKKDEPFSKRQAIAFEYPYKKHIIIENNKNTTLYDILVKLNSKYSHKDKIFIQITTCLNFEIEPKIQSCIFDLKFEKIKDFNSQSYLRKTITVKNTGTEYILKTDPFHYNSSVNKYYSEKLFQDICKQCKEKKDIFIPLSQILNKYIVNNTNVTLKDITNCIYYNLLGNKCISLDELKIKYTDEYDYTIKNNDIEINDIRTIMFELKEDNVSNTRFSLKRHIYKNKILYIPNVIETLNLLNKNNNTILELKDELQKKLDSNDFEVIDISYLCAFSIIVNKIYKLGEIDKKELISQIENYKDNLIVYKILKTIYCINEESSTKIKDCLEKLNLEVSINLIQFFNIIKSKEENKNLT